MQIKLYLSKYGIVTPKSDEAVHFGYVSGSMKYLMFDTNKILKEEPNVSINFFTHNSTTCREFMVEALSSVIREKNGIRKYKPNNAELKYVPYEIHIVLNDVESSEIAQMEYTQLRKLITNLRQVSNTPSTDIKIKRIKQDNGDYIFTICLYIDPIGNTKMKIAYVASFFLTMFRDFEELNEFAEQPSRSQARLFLMDHLDSFHNEHTTWEYDEDEDEEYPTEYNTYINNYPREILLMLATIFRGGANYTFLPNGPASAWTIPNGISREMSLLKNYGEQIRPLLEGNFHPSLVTFWAAQKLIEDGR